MLRALEREHASRDRLPELVRVLIEEVRWLHRRMEVGVPSYRPKELGQDPGPLVIPRPGEVVAETKKSAPWRSGAMRALRSLRG